MTLSPDDWIFWQSGEICLNATIVFTWLVMAILGAGSWLITRDLNSGTSISRWQNVLEVIVTGMRRQIRDVSQQEPGAFLPFIGTLFLFIALSNLLIIIPGGLYRPPTGSLSTTAALATCVFAAVPIYGIAHCGVASYLRNYVRPNVFMLPFNVVGELSRTLALAVRLYGNMMSGTVIVAILIGFVPLFVPVVIELFGMLTGIIQAYIFSILAMVYIASATRAHQTLETRRAAAEQQPNTADHEATSTGDSQ